MSVAAANSPTFPLFSSLAPEIRNQIWRDALPDKVGPALYFYKKGCWCPRRRLKSEEDYNHQYEERNLNFEFRLDVLDDSQFEVPLVFVNREARGITLAWVSEQGIEIREENTRHPIFVRPFESTCDALYLELDKWNDFLREPYDRQDEPDLLEQVVNIKSHLTRIAVPEELLRKEVATLQYMFDWFNNLRVLYIIVDAQPDLQSADNDMKVQRRWEFESTRGRALCWDDERHDFDCEDSENTCHEEVYRLIEEARKGLGEGLVRARMHSFEIRPAFAIRR
ncbi:hypothetical protein MMC21_005863 [Puttea exsequens]|nr:hypothetical protein [Puttea exsequens]